MPIDEESRSSEQSRSSLQEAVPVTRRSVASSALWSGVSTLTSVPLLALTTVLLARILGANGYGKLAVYGSLLTIIGGALELDVSTSLLRRGALAASSGTQSELLAAIRAGTTWALLQVPLNVGVSVVILPTWSSRLILICASIAGAAPVGASHYLQMTSRLRLPSVMNAASVTLKLLTVCSVGLLTHRADLVFATSTLATTCLTAFLFMGVPRELRKVIMRPGPLHLQKSDITFGVGNMVTGQLTGFAFSETEVLFFKPAQSHARGVFALAQTIGARTSLVPDAFLGTLSIGLTSAYGKGMARLRENYILATEATILVLVVFVPTALAAVAVLSGPLFGRDYHNLTPAAILLAIAAFLQTGAGPIMSVQFAQKRAKAPITAGAVSVGVDLALAITLVHDMGLAGAVVANMASSVIYVLLISLMLTSSHQLRAIGMRYLLRVCALLIYSSLLAFILISLPSFLRIGVAIPTAILWTTLGLRLPLLRMADAETFEAINLSLPLPLQQWLGRRWLRRVLGLPRSAPSL